MTRLSVSRKLGDSLNKGENVEETLLAIYRGLPANDSDEGEETSYFFGNFDDVMNIVLSGDQKDKLWAWN